MSQSHWGRRTHMPLASAPRRPTSPMSWLPSAMSTLRAPASGRSKIMASGIGSQVPTSGSPPCLCLANGYFATPPPSTSARQSIEKSCRCLRQAGSHAADPLFLQLSNAFVFLQCNVCIQSQLWLELFYHDLEAYHYVLQCTVESLWLSSIQARQWLTS